MQRIVRLPTWTADSEILIADDGNLDQTWEIVQRLATQYRKDHGLKLSAERLRTAVFSQLPSSVHANLIKHQLLYC